MANEKKQEFETLVLGDGIVEIDFSGIKSDVVVNKGSRWKPPKHVYFGPKDQETGEMLPEPEYVHQEYPRMLYKRDGAKVRAILVNDDEELAVALRDNFKKNPAEVGLITAPSFEQWQAAQRRAEASAA